MIELIQRSSSTRSLPLISMQLVNLVMRSRALRIADGMIRRPAGGSLELLEDGLGRMSVVARAGEFRPIYLRSRRRDAGPSRRLMVTVQYHGKLRDGGGRPVM